MRLSTSFGIRRQMGHSQNTKKRRTTVGKVPLAAPGQQLSTPFILSSSATPDLTDELELRMQEALSIKKLVQVKDLSLSGTRIGDEAKNVSPVGLPTTQNRPKSRGEGGE